MKEEKSEKVEHKKEILIISNNPPLVFEATRDLEKEFPNIFIEVVSSEKQKRSPSRCEKETGIPIQTITTISIPSIIIPNKNKIYELVKDSLIALRESQVL